MNEERFDPLVVGRLLRRARRDAELSQEALGDAAGVASKHLSEIERGNRDARTTTLLKLLSGLELSVEEFGRRLDEALAEQWPNWPSRR